MLTTRQALDALLAAALPIVETETVATEDANGRVLAEDIVSPIDVPPMDVSAMDGYAVRASDFGASRGFVVSQRIAAGASPSPLAAGSVARIFTGAPVPDGADAVVIQEDAIQDGDQVRFRIEAAEGAKGKPSDAPAVGQWINRRGADIRAGAVILAAGTRLTPQALGLAASVGVAQVRVGRRPKVALLFTGDELKRPGEPLVPGAIYNSNRYTLGGLLDNLGCEVTDYGIVADRLDATRAALREAAATHDLVLTSGGVSVGEEDHVKPAVEAEGHLDLWKIAMKPGKPLAFGALSRKPHAPGAAPDGREAVREGHPAARDEAYFIGLPGNPVSTFVTFLLFVRPFLLRLQGIAAVTPRAVDVRADFATRGDRRNEFLRVRLNEQGGLDLFPTQSSAVLTSTVWSDGLVDNPPDNAIAVGDTVRFIPFGALLY